jgi:hypothetical protein
MAADAPTVVACAGSLAAASAVVSARRSTGVESATSLAGLWQCEQAPCIAPSAARSASVPGIG